VVVGWIPFMIKFGRVRFSLLILVKDFQSEQFDEKLASFRNVNPVQPVFDWLVNTTSA